MLKFVQNQSLKDKLSLTPKGFVHADFFFENLVIDQNGQTSLIDFRDTYYGHPVMDITILLYQKITGTMNF